MNVSEFINTIDKIGDAACVDAFIEKTLTEFADNIVVSVPYKRFIDQKNLKTINLPNVKECFSNAFQSCIALETVNLPCLEVVSDYAFISCGSLTRLVLPSAKNLRHWVFAHCESMQYIDLGATESLGECVFWNCGSLIGVVLRGNVLCTIGVSAFNYSIHFTTRKDGYIYVPRALVEDYKVATNWSEFATQFRALEDYTVDGTITGELDETKI